MELRFTKHALFRLAGRGITLIEIEEVLAGDHEIFGKGSCRILRGKTKQNRFLDIIFDEGVQCILTVFPTKKKFRRKSNEKE